MNKMFYKTYALFFCALIFFVTSCQTTSNIQTAKTAEKVYVTNVNTIRILSPECIEQNIDCMYLFTASFEKNAFSFVSYIQADNSGFYIDLLNNFGTSMGTIEYDGQSVEVNCSLIPPKLKGEYIINDLQLCFYKSECLEQNYNSAKLKFVSATDDSGNQIRSVYKKDQLIEQVKFYDDKICIKNYLRNYEYILQLEEI